MSEMPASCLACGHACFSLDLMAGLNPEKRSLILSRSRRIHLERDETLFESGDPVQALYLLHRGRVKLTSFDTEGREQITGILSAGDTLWEDLFEPERLDIFRSYDKIESRGKDQVKQCVTVLDRLICATHMVADRVETVLDMKAAGACLPPK